MVSIPACHAGDPGSIPGRGAFFVLYLLIKIKLEFKVMESLINQSEIEQYLCFICQGVTVKPVRLPKCGHSFCLECLKQLQKASDNPR